MKKLAIKNLSMPMEAYINALQMIKASIGSIEPVEKKRSLHNYLEMFSCGNGGLKFELKKLIECANDVNEYTTFWFFTPHESVEHPTFNDTQKGFISRTIEMLSKANDEEARDES